MNLKLRKISAAMMACAAMLLGACAQSGNNGGNTAQTGVEAQPAENSQDKTNDDATANTEVIRVNNTRDFYKAIGDNRTIIIEEDLLDLVATTKRMYDDGEIPLAVREEGNFVSPNQKAAVSKESEWESTVAIVGVKNLTIKGVRPHIHLQCEVRWLAALSFYYCENLTIENLRLGHVDEVDCDAGVLYLNRCQNVKLINDKLYGCGAEGITCWSSKNLDVSGVEIYDCSMGIMSLYNTENATFSYCSFYDNYGTFDFGRDENASRNILFTKCKVRDPDFAPADFPENAVKFSECEIDTTPREEGDEPYEDYSDRDFEEDEEELPAVDKSLPRKIMHVKDAEQFITAISSNKTIIVDNDILDFTEVLNKLVEKGTVTPLKYTEEGNTQFGQVGVFYTSEYDGIGLTISNINNLTIEGANPATHIQVTPRYVNVLGFDRCQNISINNMKLGHTEAGECAGDVVNFVRCKDVNITNSKLYGCGVIGLSSYSIENLTVKNTEIYGCSNNAICMNAKAQNVLFEECNIHDNNTFFSSWSENPQDIQFVKCNIQSEYGGDETSLPNVKLTDCKVSYNHQLEGY